MTDFRMTLKYEARDIASAEHQRATELERAIALLDEHRAKLQTELGRVDKPDPLSDRGELNEAEKA
jgi:hypothetical protein